MRVKAGIVSLLLLAAGALGAWPAGGGEAAAPRGGPVAGKAAPVEEVREDYLWIKTVRGDFEEVVASLKAAAASRNFPIVGVRDYKKSFSKRLAQLGGGSLPFAEFRIFEVCNVMLALESLRRDLRMGVFLPCRIAVYTRVGSDEVTLVTINPNFMPKALKNPELVSIAKQVEEMILEVFQAVEY